MKLKFNIVALSHNDVADHFLEYARTVEGKYLNLVPDNENAYDPMAVKAYDGKIFLGYVAAQDSEDVRALLLASGKKALRTKCTGYGSKEDGKSGLYLKAETRVWLDDEEDSELEVCGGRISTLSANGKPLPMPESLREAYGKIFDDRDLEQWQYTGPVFSIDSLSRIDDCTTILEDELEEYVRIAIRTKRTAQSEAQQIDELSMLETEGNEQLETFMQNHRYDFSREMGQTRKHIQSLLLLTANERLLARRDELLADLGYLSSSGCREAAARNIFIDTPKAIKQGQTGTYDYSDRLDEIEHQLGQFPMDIYRKFKADPVDFFREIFYKRIPRKQMKQFLSGIILMIMNGRVGDAQRWGKHDDQDALQEMKEVCHFEPKHDAGDIDKQKAEKALLCIRKVAYIYNEKTFKYLIHSQSDWYAVYRALVDLGIYEDDAHKSFAEYIQSIFENAKDEKRPHVPICKKKDLDQASEHIFDKTSVENWSTLSKEDLADIQPAKFKRYCEIVDSFLQMMREEK